MNTFPPGMLNFGNKPIIPTPEIKNVSLDSTLYVGNLPP